MLFRVDTWREGWLSLRRAHKDRRARKHLRQLAWLVLVPFLCLAYIGWIVGQRLIFVVPVLLVIFGWKAWSHHKKEGSLSLLPPHKPLYRVLTSQEQAGFRQYFADMALIYAVMLDRAGSETYLRNKVLPEGVEVTTRRVHLDLLKSRGLWDRMAQCDREAMMMPDGQWNPGWIEQLLMGFEPLRLMRWILRVDFHLPVVGRQLRFDYKLANEIVRAPGKLYDGKELITVSQMETAQRAAESYYNRCIAERIFRGDAEAANEESSRIAASVANLYRNKQHEDLVLGVKLVSETSSQELEWATMVSRRRMGFFHWTMIALERGTPPEPPYKFQP